AGATGDVRDAVRDAGAHHLGDLRGGGRQDHDPGYGRVRGQPVAGVRAQLVRVGDHPVGTDDAPQRRGECLDLHDRTVPPPGAVREDRLLLMLTAPWPGTPGSARAVGWRAP